MAFDNNMTYHVFKDFNVNIDNGAQTYVSVRLAQWLKAGQEPDESKAKYEIRNNKITPEGEMALKGVSFKSKESLGELAEGLIDVGFGDTKKILGSIVKREDFKNTVNNFDKDPDDDSDGELFDMRTLLLGLSDENDMDDMEE